MCDWGACERLGLRLFVGLDKLQDSGVDVDNQKIAVSAIWTCIPPVPWDATCE
jgi:hypothetical protein